MKRVCPRCQGALCAHCGCCHAGLCRWFVSLRACWSLPARPTVVQRRAMLHRDVLLSVRYYEQALHECYLPHLPRSREERRRQVEDVEMMLRLVLDSLGMLLPAELWQVVERLLATYVAVSERQIVPAEEQEVRS